MIPAYLKRVASSLFSTRKIEYSLGLLFSTGSWCPKFREHTWKTPHGTLRVSLAMAALLRESKSQPFERVIYGLPYEAYSNKG